MKQTTMLALGAAAVLGFLWWRSEQQKNAAALARQQAQMRAAEAERAKRQEGATGLPPFADLAQDAAANVAVFLGSSEFQDAMGTATEIAAELAAAGTEGVLEGLESYSAGF